MPAAHVASAMPAPGRSAAEFWTAPVGWPSLSWWESASVSVSVSVLVLVLGTGMGAATARVTPCSA
ncbi:hypothetical protein [Salinispora pacifica]|uniref:hypothetical protein n=1 Tax=Salinispora pacifica TaxID=351187 RepID=UPI00047630AF